MKKVKPLTQSQKEARTCNLGSMTPAMKNSMIKWALRKLSMYWKPIQKAKQLAKVDRREVPTEVLYHNPTKTMPDRLSNTVMINYYLCNHCNNPVPEKVPVFTETIIKSKMLWPRKWYSMKLKNNIDIDHINPVVEIWSQINWHEVIERLLDEKVENYQVLCKPCHKDITLEENKQRKI